MEYIFLNYLRSETDKRSIWQMKLDTKLLGRCPNTLIEKSLSTEKSDKKIPIVKVGA